MSKIQSRAELKRLPLSTLHLHPRNVRQTQASEAEFIALKASIATHGLINPLSVVKDKKGYAVFAGGRRLQVLYQLDKGGELTDNLNGGIPCNIYDDATSVAELSLAENEVRAAMIAADQIEAWHRLSKDGLTAEQIAQNFGQPQNYVLKLMKLGGLAPQVMKAFRAGDITMRELQAFTLVADHK